ncbi:LysR substrate-binding domain-containing protein [Paracraurococcus lichenis]|uniref:LysR substrate-binding domain-containing protein n=1 Tax=Paracraurococcus lichenis TaxID=3064888 RepID=A0ABT9E3Q4_9PROT|nr:LysR substrate-binding domain-containing protein [Paracraurococcus sp. LOR1-02]MDO9710791.1 LysR substrate-binding domain-containing protein [Paracraurococcus sp. LOR1-02]
MRRLPSFSALRAFEAAARLESFALAGAELHLSPSAVSHQVRALEDWAGRKLFHRRSGQGVEPTPEGRALLGRLTPILDELEAACAALRPEPAAEALAVHCVPSFAANWLGPRLPGFMARHPGLGIRVTASAEPVDLARQAEIDLAIAYGAAPAQPGVTAEPLGTERVTALVAPALAAGLDFSGPALPRGLTLIDSAVSPVRWEDWLALNGLTTPAGGARPSFDRGAMAIAAAAQGVGAALESTRLAAEDLARGDLVELDGSRFRAVERVLHHLCYRTGQRNLPKVAAFRAWLLEACARD